MPKRLVSDSATSRGEARSAGAGERRGAAASGDSRRSNSRRARGTSERSERHDALAAEREHREEQQRGEHRVEAGGLDAFDRSEQPGGAGHERQSRDAGRWAERRRGTADHHRDEETKRQIRPVLAGIRDARELDREPAGETADRRRGDERAEPPPRGRDAERGRRRGDLARGAQLDPRTCRARATLRPRS